MTLHQLKEAMLSHSMRRLWWVDTRDMVSDGLNKGAVSREALLKLGNDGVWTLQFQPVGFSETKHIPIVARVIAPNMSPELAQIMFIRRSE